MINAVNSSNVPEAVGPYSHGMESNGLVFTSGQLPIDKKSGKIPSTIEEQTLVSLTNVKHVLETAGTSVNKVIKTTVFLSNMDDFQKMNEIYATFFTKPFPARSCIEAARLPMGVLVEVEAVAAAR